jgi:hypothetical protein
MPKMSQSVQPKTLASRFQPPGSCILTATSCSKIGPRKQRKTQIDRGAVECVDRILKIEPYIIVGVEFTRAADQYSGEIMPHAPIA